MEMDFLATILLVAGILFVSTFIRSAVGFGDALLAMPLLALIVSLQTATPLVAFMSMMVSIGILLTDWQTVDLRSAWRLIIASLAGIPLGLVLLNLAPEAQVKGGLGILLVLYGLYNLLTPGLPLLTHEKLAYPFGFIAGILGGAYNTNGPPVVIYGALRRWEPNYFRATLQCYFFFTNILILAGHGLAGLWTPLVWRLYLYSIPVICLGIYLGGKANRHIPKAMFSRVIYSLLIVVGVLFLISSR
jgi:uncharacterized membrane protein YfcA